jgi:hypothetical protein
MEIDTEYLDSKVKYTLNIKNPLYEVIERLKLLDNEEYENIVKEIIRQLIYEF